MVSLFSAITPYNRLLSFKILAFFSFLVLNVASLESMFPLGLGTWIPTPILFSPLRDTLRAAGFVSTFFALVLISRGCIFPNPFRDLSANTCPSWASRPQRRRGRRCPSASLTRSDAADSPPPPLPNYSPGSSRIGSTPSGVTRRNIPRSSEAVCLLTALVKYLPP